MEVATAEENHERKSQPSRVHFDNLFMSYSAITNYVLNEEWHISMYMAIRTNN